MDIRNRSFRGFAHPVFFEGAVVAVVERLLHYSQGILWDLLFNLQPPVSTLLINDDMEQIVIHTRLRIKAFIYVFIFYILTRDLKYLGKTGETSQCWACQPFPRPV